MAGGRQAADHELEMWARAVLIGSRRPGPYDEVRAYRILAAGNPEAYAARLARALVNLSWEAGYRTAPQARLALLEEAVAAARGVRGPDRADLVVEILDWYQRFLYERGRRADGLAVRAEMAAAAREALARTGSGSDRAPGGLRVLALGLAEEGRHDEAAAVFAELLAVTLSRPRRGTEIWDRYSLTAHLDAAGRTDEAVAALGAVVDEKRADLRTGDTSLSDVFLALVWYSQLLDRAGRRPDADAARDEALGLLRRLAGTGEPRNWSGAQFTTAGVLIAAQAQDLEPDGLPRPAFGTDPMDWSGDLRARYLDEPAADGFATLDAAARQETRPRELAVLRRRLAVRVATHRLWRDSHRFLDPTLPFFDESVAAARRARTDRALVVRALVDRAMVLVAGHRYADALTDYTEALNLSG